MKHVRHIVAVCAAGGLLAACGSNSSDAPPAAAQRVQGGAVLAASTQVSQHAPDEYQDLVQQIYLAYFGRPADFTGLSFWMQTFSDRGFPLQTADMPQAYVNNVKVKEVIDMFVASAESQALYTGNDQAFVNAVYRNLFNRNAEPDGLNFWTGFLQRKVLTRGQVMLYMLAGGQNDDAIVEQKKTQAAQMFTASTVAAGASAVMSYSSDGVVQAVREWIGTITAKTDLSTIQPQIDTLVKQQQEIPGPFPAVDRYSGFQYLQDLTSNGPAYSAYYEYAVRGIVPANAGTLSYGVVPQTLSWTQTSSGSAFNSSYGLPIATNFSLPLQGGMPAVAMLCQPATLNGIPTIKSTDILVANSVHRVTNARDLANQTISTYREDCAQANTNAKSFVFDANGAATVALSHGVSTYNVDAVNQILAGQALPDLSSGTYMVLAVYSYTRPDGGTGYFMVQHQGTSLSGLKDGVLGIWSQQ